MGSDGSDVEGDVEVPPSVGPEGIRDAILVIWGGGIGVVIGGIGIGDDRDVAHEEIYL